MSLNSGEGFKKTQKQLPPPGLHLGVCYAIIDLGTQVESFNNQPKKVPKVQFCFELPGLPMIVFDQAKGAQPQALFGDYTVAAGDQAKLPKMLSSWAGGFKVEKISEDLLRKYLGQACTICVEHAVSTKDVDSDTGKALVYANIGLKGLQVMPRMSEMVKPAGTVNKQIFFSLDSFSWEAYESLPKHIQDKIAKSAEWTGILAKYPKSPAPATQNNNVVNPQQNNVMPEQNTTVHTGNPTMPAF